MGPTGWIDADAQETLPADCKTPLASEPLVERQGEVPGSEGRRWREVLTTTLCAGNGERSERLGSSLSAERV